jgi:hypothetical protein
MGGENHAAGSAELVYVPVIFGDAFTGSQSLLLPASAPCLACVRVAFVSSCFHSMSLTQVT